MREKRVECPKCKKAMGPGFLIDRGESNRKHLTQWVEGTPRKSFWSGISTSKAVVLSVSTYRCMTCGYLESYARP